jgi:broad specificity phosphatase PhoE
LAARPDPARRTEAIVELMRRIVGLVDSLAAGHPPSNAVARAIVAHGGDVGAAITEVLGRRHGRVDR